ncbi:MAG: uroporphyrinogen decarboxylase family protein [Promethearchaeota archaeon]
MLEQQKQLDVEKIYLKLKPEDFKFTNDSLTSRERILKTLNHEEPDRVPITELSMDSQIIAKFFKGKLILSGVSNKLLSILKLTPFWRHIFAKGINSKSVVASQIKTMVDLYIKMYFDMVCVPLCLFPTKGHNSEWRKIVLPTPRHYVDEFGRKFEIIQTRYGPIVYYKDGILKTPEIYEKFGPVDPNHPSRTWAAEAAIKYSKKNGKEEILPVPAAVGVVESTWEGMGLPAFSKYLRKDKNFIKKVMKDRADFTIQLIKNIEYFEFPVFLIYDDYGYKQGPFINPKLFKELVVPQIKRISNAAHECGMKILLHSCGNLNEILDDVINTGIDGLHPIEPTAYMNIFEVKKKYSNKITLIGNVSPQDLQDKTPDYIRDYVRKLMEILPKNGGYIFSSGHSINPAVKLENYLAMRAEFLKYCYYKS